VSGGEKNGGASFDEKGVGAAASDPKQEEEPVTQARSTKVLPPHLVRVYIFFPPKLVFFFVLGMTPEHCSECQVSIHQVSMSSRQRLE
jgi:hypothetical protein